MSQIVELELETYFNSLTDSPEIVAEALLVSEELKDLLDELNFEEIEQKLDDVLKSENKDDPGDR